MTEKTKIDLLQHMKVGEEILINDVRQILLHFNAEKRIVYVKDVKSIDGASIKVDLSEVSFLPKELNSNALSLRSSPSSKLLRSDFVAT